MYKKDLMENIFVAFAIFSLILGSHRLETMWRQNISRGALLIFVPSDRALSTTRKVWKITNLGNTNKDI